MNTRIGVLVVTRLALLVTRPKPNDTSGTCRGNIGLNSVATVTPSGCTKAKYSPLAESLNEVCSGGPGMRRSFPEAKTTRNAPALRLVLGKRHCVRSPALSVRYQPPKFTGPAPAL